MGGLYTHTTRAAGTVLTAAIYNADHQNHIDNDIPTMMDNYSKTLAQMQTVTDPGEIGTESLATALSGELERLRFAIQDLKTIYDSTLTRWYQTPTGLKITGAGPHAIGGATVAGTSLSLYGSGALHTLDLLYGAGNTQGLRFTSAGILAVGTTVVTGAAAGGIVLANNKSLYGVNAAGNNSFVLVLLDTTNRLNLGDANVVDILWSKPLVALGGGAAPTLGTIGGSGPATAAQNTWMRVVDSTGAAFWVPAWK